MHNFSHPLAVGPDNATARSVIGLRVSGLATAFIRDPFGVDLPVFAGATPEAHGITAADAAELRRLNETLTAAVDSALDAGCLAIQVSLGVSDGGFAGMYFSGNAAQAVSEVLARYLVAQAEEVCANTEADALDNTLPPAQRQRVS